MISELMLLLSAFIFILSGIILWRRSRHLLSQGKKTQAVIHKNNVLRTGSKKGELYYPVVRFKADHEKWVTQELNVGYSPAKPTGSRLPVIYDPESPEVVEVNSPFRLQMVPRFLILLGILILIFASLHYLEVFPA